MSLPLFVNDPRYVLLPSVSARKEAFDEYCRDRARELRQSKVKQEKQAANPKEEFETLLREEVKSTRTSWTEWRRQWKKDRRFYGWGKDDREREKRFRDYLKELGESECCGDWHLHVSTDGELKRKTRRRTEGGGGFLRIAQGEWYRHTWGGVERRVFVFSASLTVVN